MSQQISHDPLAERGVLAAVFDDPEIFPIVSEVLDSEDFYEPNNALIYTVMLSMYQAGEDIGVIQLQHKLSRDGLLTQAGGFQYLLELTNPDAVYAYVANILDYVNIIKEHADKRKMQSAALLIEEKTRPGSGYSADEVLSFAETAIQNIAEKSAKTESVRMSDFIDSELDAIIERGKTPEGVTTGVPSGFLELDKITTGFQAGQMILIGARPAMGKSTIAVDFVRGATIRAGKTAMFFSLEMSKEEISNRIIAAESLVELQKIRTGKNLTADDWNRIRKARNDLYDANIIIDDNSDLSMLEMKTKCERQAKRPEGLDLVVLDYLQLLDMTAKGSNTSRQEAVSAASRDIKLLAKKLGIPVIVLSQLNRGSEQRGDKKPAASDLRESGSLEQDADLIFLLHRPEVYDENDRPGQADLILIKHRNGPTKTFVLVPLLNVSKFASGVGMFPADIQEPLRPDEVVPEDTNYDPYAVPEEPKTKGAETIVPTQDYSQDPFSGASDDLDSTAW